MIADRVRIDCRLEDDARLLEGVAVIVSFAAANVGISAKPREALALAILDACRRALGSVGKKRRTDSTIRILVDQCHDRLEITIECPAAEDLNAFAPCEQAEQLAADFIHKEIRDGVARVKFIKHCGALDSKKA